MTFGFFFVDADGTQMPAWLIGVVVLLVVALVVGAVLFVVYSYYKSNQWLRKTIITRTEMLRTYFCRHRKTILLLGQDKNRQSYLVHTFNFAINLTENKKAKRTGDGNCDDDSHSAKLMMYRDLYKDLPVNQRGPVFLDSQGLLKEEAKLVKPILPLLLSGQIPLETNLNDISKDIERYIHVDSERKPDIVLLVWSAKEADLLTELIEPLGIKRGDDDVELPVEGIHLGKTTSESVIFCVSFSRFKN